MINLESSCLQQDEYSLLRGQSFKIGSIKVAYYYNAGRLLL